MEQLRRFINTAICIGALACGIGGIVWLVATKPTPDRHSAAKPPPRVEVFAVEPVLFEAPVIGYGTVRPKRQVKIIPEVGGRLVKVHEDLAEGNIIVKGELLFEIDSRVYESKVRQVEADIRRLEAQLRRHEKNRISLEGRLALAKRQEELVRRDFEREKGLFAKGAGRDPEVERAEDRYLRQQGVVLEYESQLDLIPIQIEETTALLETKRAQLDEAKLNVDRTKIHCPFDARVDSVTAQESQVVIANFHIATLTDMQALEIPVVIDPRELRWTDQKAFDQNSSAAPEARVTWTLLGQEFSWTGKVTRLERMDEVTRSAHIVVEVRDIVRNLKSGKGQHRPALSVGMFCRAELPTEPLEDALVIPRHALHDGTMVYVFEPDAADPNRGHLAVKRVPVLRNVGNQVLVAFRQDDAGGTGAGEFTTMAELKAGELVVTSPLAKIVEGMHLELRDSTETVLVAFADSPEAPATGCRAEPVSGSPACLLGAVTGAR